MTLLLNAAVAKRLDTRTLERQLQSGKVTQKEVDDHVRVLPDDAANMVEVTWADLEKQEKTDRRLQ